MHKFVLICLNDGNPQIKLNFKCIFFTFAWSCFLLLGAKCRMWLFDLVYGFIVLDTLSTLIYVNLFLICHICLAMFNFSIFLSFEFFFLLMTTLKTPLNFIFCHFVLVL